MGRDDFTDQTVRPPGSLRVASKAPRIAQDASPPHRQMETTSHVSGPPGGADRDAARPCLAVGRSGTRSGDEEEDEAGGGWRTA